jgi:hypothetical protein
MESIVPPVLIADDGELRELRQLLDALDVPYAELGSEAPAEPMLLISNVRHALAGASGRRDSPRLCGRFHIVVAEKLSRTLQQEMRRLRPDFLLERPVDPASLRLLVCHALYRGPERRRSDRAAVRAVVKLRIGLATRKAMLVDLSQSGCRLVSQRPIETGGRLAIRLPRELTGGRGLTLQGRVVGVDFGDELEPAAHAASVAFEGLDPETRKRIRAVMAEHAVGAGPLRPHRSEERPGPAAPPARPPRTTPPRASERRGAARGLFERSILAAGRGGSHVLIGRDLSRGGMRVAPDPRLDLGDVFNLVIHGPGARRPSVVRAVVARDDGADGCLLRFESLSETGRAALEEILAALPPLQADPSGAAPNVVVSEVVEPAWGAAARGNLDGRKGPLKTG